MSCRLHCSKVDAHQASSTTLITQLNKTCHAHDHIIVKEETSISICRCATQQNRQQHRLERVTTRRDRQQAVSRSYSDQHIHSLPQHSSDRPKNNSSPMQPTLLNSAAVSPTSVLSMSTQRYATPIDQQQYGNRSVYGPPVTEFVRCNSTMGSKGYQLC